MEVRLVVVTVAVEVDLIAIDLFTEEKCEA